MLKSNSMMGLKLEPANNCLMRYINDWHGTKLKANCVLIECETADLGPFEGHKLLQVMTSREITAGTQLVMDHKTSFFTNGHIDDEGTPAIGDTSVVMAKRRRAREVKALKTGQSALEYGETTGPEDYDDEGDDDEGDDDGRVSDVDAGEKIGGTGPAGVYPFTCNCVISIDHVVIWM